MKTKINYGICKTIYDDGSSSLLSGKDNDKVLKIHINNSS